MFNNFKIHVFYTLLFAASINTASAQTLFTFESLPIPSSGFNQGDVNITGPSRNFFNIEAVSPGAFGGAGSFFDQTLNVLQDGQSLSFTNTFETSFGSFTGFATSNVADSTTPGFGNQFAAFPGSGAGGSSNYLVNFGSGSSLTGSTLIDSIDITNTTFAALAVLGDDGSTPSIVSGPLANSNGNFDLTIQGNNLSAAQQQIVISLADFQNGANFLLDIWQTLDVSVLQSNELTFSLSGSDVGLFGLNTPAYFAIDNVVLAAAVPEPSAVVLLCGMSLGGVLLRRRSK